MKRGLIIAASFLFLPAGLFSQAGPLSGSLRYEHQYQEILVNGALLTSLRRSPSLNLNTKGFFSSKNFVYYTLRTSLNTNFRTSHTPSSIYDTRQLLWNAYDVNLFFLQSSPVNFDVAAREYTTDIRYDYGSADLRSGTRDREVRANFSVIRVPFLPTINVGYRRSRSYSIVHQPYEQVTSQYTFSASSSNLSGGSANVSGSLSDFRERYSGFGERILTLQMNGQQLLEPGHQLTFGSEYNKYGSYSALSGGLGYGGVLDDGVRISSSVTGQNASGRNYAVRSVSASQGISVKQGDHLQWGGSLSGGAGVSTLALGGAPRRIPTSNWTGSVNLSHNRNFGALMLVNNLSFGYGERLYIDRQSFWRASLGNTLQRTVGRFALNATYNFSTLVNSNSFSWRSVEHYAMFSATGTLPAAIRSRSTLDYRSYTYGGSRPTGSDQITLNGSQSFDGNFTMVIPFTLGAGGAIHWYLASLRGHTYSWHVRFQSSNFFMKSLYAGYQYQRRFDPYYNKESREQSATLSYRWRSLAFGLTAREITLFSRQRDIRFTVERSF